VDSENPIGADDQQERPGLEQWIVGFVDGEGCFSCPIQRNKVMRIGWQLQPVFAVVQSERSLEALVSIQDFFGCGRIYRNRRHDNHREDLMVYQAFRYADLRDIIVPFFERYPLRTAKADDFRKFATIIEMMGRRVHLSVDGLTKIARIVETMNHRKPSRFLESSEAIRQPALFR
jgi:hypothetical protein